MGWWNYDGRHKPATPREAKSGIKAHSKGGKFGASWWAKRWIFILESFNIGARLGRGRSYARCGQVLSIEIEKGTVKAKVQGSRKKPYSVSINIKTIPLSEWKKLAGELKTQAIFAAKLLSGEMPQDIEQAFEKARLSLFPEKLNDLQTECSCPDWSNPCKHIAAVYYLLGEEFDRDPFLIFRLRGMNREEIIELLSGTAEGEGGKKKSKVKPEPRETSEESPRPCESLATDSWAFWGESALAEDIFGEVRIPPVVASLPKRLGGFPFWRGGERFMEAMEAMYKDASPQGMDVFLGEWKGGRK